MRKIITFENPITVDQDGTKLTVESVAGEVQYRNGKTSFRPDFRGLEYYINLQIPEEEESVIKQAVESASVRRIEPVQEKTEGQTITKGE